MVPRPRIELGTRRFSGRQLDLCVEILQHLASVGQAASQLLSSLNDDHENDNLPNFGVLTSKFSALHKLPLDQPVFPEVNSKGRD